MAHLFAVLSALSLLFALMITAMPNARRQFSRLVGTTKDYSSNREAAAFLLLSSVALGVVGAGLATVTLITG